MAQTDVEKDLDDYHNELYLFDSRTKMGPERELSAGQQQQMIKFTRESKRRLAISETNVSAKKDIEKTKSLQKLRAAFNKQSQTENVGRSNESFQHLAKHNKSKRNMSEGHVIRRSVDENQVRKQSLIIPKQNSIDDDIIVIRDGSNLSQVFPKSEADIIANALNESLEVRVSDTDLAAQDSTFLVPEPDEFHADFALVYSKSHVEANPNKIQIIANLLDYMYNMGLEYITLPHSEKPDVIFILICAHDVIVLHYAELFQIELLYRHTEYEPATAHFWNRFFNTDLAYRENLPDLFTRGKDILYKGRAQKILSIERILVIKKILNSAEFSEELGDIGLHRLKQKKIITHFYPLHDGDLKWTDKGPLNARQVLAKYWANIRYIFKRQPLDIVHRYFGSEIAFYFAFVGFYNEMLVYASIASTIILFFNIMYCLTSDSWDEYCYSELPMCPRCLIGSPCHIKYLSKSCVNATLTCILDTPFTLFYAIFLSCWSAMFLKLWNRQEIVYQYKWNTSCVKVHNHMRPEFMQRTKYRRISPYSGKLEPYVPAYIRIVTLTFTFFVIIILILMLVGVWVFVTTFRIKSQAFLDEKIAESTLKSIAFLLNIAFWSLIHMIFVIVFEVIYVQIALLLTKFENLRTQSEFDNSYTYKIFVLTCANLFIPVFYIAFFKGNFSHTPLKVDVDMCELPSCVLEVSIQIFLFMFVRTVTQHVKSFLMIFYRKLKSKTKATSQWEKDFALEDVGNYSLLYDYMQLVTQFAFITFFATIFPFAPMLALLLNFFEVRLDAIRMNNMQKRVMPKYVATIGSWNGLLEVIYIVSVAVNAFTLIFTSKVFQEAVFWLFFDFNLRGYVLYTLSAFDVEDFPANRKPENYTGLCYYKAFNYGPYHPKKYEFTSYFWWKLLVEAFAVIIFEFIIWMSGQVLRKTVQTIPKYILESIRTEQRELKELRWKDYSEAQIQMILKRIKRKNRNKGKKDDVG